MIADLATATPRDIDARLAELHHENAAVSHTIDSLTNRVLDHAGLREYVSATWQTRKSSYRVLGTFEEGVARLEAYAEAFAAWRAADYAQELRPEPLSNYAGSVNVAETVRDREAAIARRYALWAEMNTLEAEHTRRPWSRFFLVTSSAGHIHASMGCQTCRRTTTYGWLPDLSGQSEAEAVAAHGPALCSVCFPSAPLDHVGGKLTKAQAAKLAA